MPAAKVNLGIWVFSKDAMPESPRNPSHSTKKRLGSLGNPRFSEINRSLREIEGNRLRFRNAKGVQCMALVSSLDKKCCYFAFDPLAICGRSRVRIESPEGSLAASSIPWDSTPLIFAGLRFAISTIFLPINSSQV